MPRCPPEFRYLVEWAEELHGRSGVGMGMVAPVAHREIEAWARMMDIGSLDPMEVEALRVFDAALFTTGEQHEDPVTLNDTPKKSKVLPWPTRKEPQA